MKDHTVPPALPLDRLQLDGLTVFVAVAEARGFRSAARNLGVTPSAVSQSVRALETRIGAPLFVRTTRSVGLSEAGERLLAHARPALELLSNGLSAASHLGGAVSGRLRISVPRASLPLFANTVVPEFVANHPEVELDLVGDDELIDIVHHGFDAGVRFGTVAHADMVGTWLTRPEKLVVVGSPDFLDRHGVPTTPSDLKRLRCITFRRSDTVVQQWHFVVDGQRVAIPVRGPLITNDVEAAICAAIRGVGLFYVPRSLACQYAESRRLTLLLESFSDEVPGLTLYYPNRHQALPRLHAFRNIAIKHMRTELSPLDYRPNWVS